MGTGGGYVPMIIEKPRRLFNIYNEEYGTGYAGNVWDVESICPTLETCGGGTDSR